MLDHVEHFRNNNKKWFTKNNYSNNPLICLGVNSKIYKIKN